MDIVKDHTETVKGYEGSFKNRFRGEEDETM